MAFERAKVALAALEEKLRRQLGLAGDIGATFAPNLTPVIIAGDLRDGGNAAHKGRWFSWASGLLGANSYQSVGSTAEILITHIVLSGNTAAANLGEVYVTAADQTPGAGAPGTLAGTWIDRKTVGTDQAPLLQTATGGVILGGVDRSDANRIVSFMAIQGAQLVVPVQLMIPVGGAINCRAGASSLVWGFTGRIYP